MKNTNTPDVEIERLRQEFQDYTHVVSHDLSAPLRAVVEFSKLLKSDHAAALNNEGQLYLSLIIDSGVKMQKMMEGLLSYSRLNTVPLRLEKIDCAAVFNLCLEKRHIRMDETKAVVHCHNLPVLTGDAAQVEQLFMVLLDNALTFSFAERSPHIEFSAVLVDGQYRFVFQDNGIGIHEECFELIFKPFGRLHGDDMYPGVGMGLALAKRIVENHGGKIWVESTPDKGTSFIFTLAPRASQ